MSVIPQFISISGPRLTLRTPIPEDDVVMREIISDLTTMRHLRFMTKEPEGWTLEQIKERREAHLDGQRKDAVCLLHILETSTGKLIGTTGLPHVDLKNRNGKYGIILHHTSWKHRYGTEAHLLGMTYAFETLKLHRVMFETFTENSAMRGFFDRYGIQLEAIRKHCITKPPDGEFMDGADYVIFEDEWPACKKLMEEALAKEASSQQ